ncbi:MAG: hypothetical protein UX62_C0040G0005 [Microgenomates group bacterium GW2011_GWA2_46_7]|nr:MAG: hypothetical protein UX62_C0040G0005 [Microgenomates group bacterium GW2011_GWA2_46_7]
MLLLTAFLDTSVILSGLHSPSGRSAMLFRAATKKKVKLITTPLVLAEAAEYIAKLSIQPLQLEELFTASILTIIPNPPEITAEKFKTLTTDPDDVHVLAGAALSGATVLLSLDKKHIITPRVKLALRPMKVLSPKEFWRWIMRGNIKLF